DRRPRAGHRAEAPGSRARAAGRAPALPVERGGGPPALRPGLRAAPGRPGQAGARGLRRRPAALPAVPLDPRRPGADRAHQEPAAGSHALTESRIPQTEYREEGFPPLRPLRGRGEGGWNRVLPGSGLQYSVFGFRVTGNPPRVRISCVSTRVKYTDSSYYRWSGLDGRRS